VPKKTQVLFLPSIPENLKYFLLKNAACLMYTPSNEHFGIVPLEAMYAKCPVIACDSGGPRETIISGETGFLCEPNSVAFSEKLAIVLREKKEYGKIGNALVLSKFSLDSLQCSLHELLVDLNQRQTSSLDRFLFIIAVFLVVTCAAL
jgi:alpha-1,3/alpha-1,6-mannosyltransferase